MNTYKEYYKENIVPALMERFKFKSKMALIIDEIFSIDKQAEIRFWGGDNMIKSGGYNVKHIKELAFMGFYEVLKNFITIVRNINFCKNDIKEFSPDKIIYIDYPGFNLKICKWAKNNGYKNYYYISPQIWAWKENRIKTIKKCIFTKLYYSSYN